MPKTIPPVRFNATGALQLYLVPESGRYAIEAAGAQGGGNPTACGGKGAHLRGVFELRAGEVLNLVVGKQGLPGLNLPLLEDTESEFARPESSGSTPALSRGGGGGGGTFVWRNTPIGGWPTLPLLAAGGGGGGGADPGGDAVVTADAARMESPAGRNGHGGSSEVGVFYYGGGGGTGWLTPGVHGGGPTYCQGGTQWEGGAGASFGGYMGGHGGYGGGGGGCFFRSGAGGGGGYSGGSGGGGRTGRNAGGGSSFNSGTERFSAAGIQTGDGWVRISCLSLVTGVSVSDDAWRGAGHLEHPAAPHLTVPVHATRLPHGTRWQYFPS